MSFYQLQQVWLESVTVLSVSKTFADIIIKVFTVFYYTMYALCTDLA